MGVLKRIATETRANTLSAPDDALKNVLTGGTLSYTGKHVSPYSATSLATVYSAVRTYTDAVSTSTLNVYRTVPEGKQLAIGTREWKLLVDEPNPEMDGVDLYEIIMHQLQLFGNAFVLKQRDTTGLVTELWPTDPGRFQIKRVEGVKYYTYQPLMGPLVLGTDRDFLHIKAPSILGIEGLSPIQQCMQRLGIIAAQEQFQGSFYKNSANPTGMITMPNTVSDEAMKRIVADWNRTHSGFANAGSVVFVEPGMDFKALTMPLNEQEFIAQVQMSLVDVANMFRLPVWKLNSGPSGNRSITYATSEGQNLSFYVDSLMPWLGKIERALKRDGDIIIDPTISPKFDVDDLLRADHSTRAAISVSYVSAGIYTPDEARALEDKPPLPDGEGAKAKDLNSVSTTSPAGPVTPVEGDSTGK